MTSKEKPLLTAEEQERELLAIAVELETVARESLRKHGSVSVAIATAFRTALSARKQASLLADRREDRAYGDRLIAHQRRMAGLNTPASSERPPLKIRRDK